MAYIVPTDFRAPLAEYCVDIPLTTTEASDPQLSDAIDRLSQRFDNMTVDHFEPVNATISLNGGCTPRLFLPRRCITVNTVAIADTLGALTIQAATVYRLHSSLDSTGARRLTPGDLDYLELIWAAGGLSGYPADHYDPYSWPSDTNSVQVNAIFGWSATPDDVKRAVALMVYDHFKPLDASLRRTQSFTTENAAINLSGSQPTGLPEVDAIIRDYTFDSPSVGIA